MWDNQVPYLFQRCCCLEMCLAKRKQITSKPPSSLSYSSHRRFQSDFRFPLINPLAPSPLASLGAGMRGGEPGTLAEGLCIAVDVGLLASFGRQ
jgi:hypothetical protein